MIKADLWLNVGSTQSWCHTLHKCPTSQWAFAHAGLRVCAAAGGDRITKWLSPFNTLTHSCVSGEEWVDRQSVCKVGCSSIQTRVEGLGFDMLAYATRLLTEGLSTLQKRKSTIQVELQLVRRNYNSWWMQCVYRGNYRSQSLLSTGGEAWQCCASEWTNHISCGPCRWDEQLHFWGHSCQAYGKPLCTITYPTLVLRKNVNSKKHWLEEDFSHRPPCLQSCWSSGSREHV